LASTFTNTGDNPVNYVYTKNATAGRLVVSMVTAFKVPLNEVAAMETKNKRGCAIDVKLRFKKLAGADLTSDLDAGQMEDDKK
jgi:hypothetical protein